ncbi:hypothetical protein [Lysinibacillus sp. TE18511]
MKRFIVRPQEALCESEATATNVFCAKAKRQQQMFSVRKQSVSTKASSWNGNHPYEPSTFIK